MKKSMAMVAVFEVATEADATSVVAHLTDNIRNLGKTWGVNRIYRDIFNDVARRMDLALAKLDGAAAQSFGESRFWSRAAEVAVLEQTNVLSGKVGAIARSGAAGRAINGSSDRTPLAWKGVDAVTFHSSAGFAIMTLADVQAELGVAVMVVSHSGPCRQTLPATSSRSPGWSSSDSSLPAAGQPSGRSLRCPSAGPWSSSRQQASAPVAQTAYARTAHLRHLCRLEKITNPEYERIANRNQKIGDIVAGVGATISTGGISPTFVLGQAFKLGASTRSTLLALPGHGGRREDRDFLPELRRTPEGRCPAVVSEMRLRLPNEGGRRATLVRDRGGRPARLNPPVAPGGPRCHARPRPCVAADAEPAADAASCFSPRPRLGATRGRRPPAAPPAPPLAAPPPSIPLRRHRR